MKSQIPELIVGLLIKVGIVIVLFIAAITSQQYGFYNFVRWTVMVPSIYFAFLSYRKRAIGQFICFTAFAIVFNPVAKFWFQKSTWHIVDYVTAGIFITIIVFESITLRKLNK